jgi:hypothetical protein
VDSTTGIVVSIYIKYSKKGHFVKECGTIQGKPLGFKNRT